VVTALNVQNGYGLCSCRIDYTIGRMGNFYQIKSRLLIEICRYVMNTGGGEAKVVCFVITFLQNSEATYFSPKALPRSLLKRLIEER